MRDGTASAPRLGLAGRSACDSHSGKLGQPGEGWTAELVVIELEVVLAAEAASPAPKALIPGRQAH